MNKSQQARPSRGVDPTRLVTRITQSPAQDTGENHKGSEGGGVGSRYDEAGCAVAAALVSRGDIKTTSILHVF